VRLARRYGAVANGVGLDCYADTLGIGYLRTHSSSRITSSLMSLQDFIGVPREPRPARIWPSRAGPEHTCADQHDGDFVLWG
jgi:hypothetical protein